jgi:anaphase-promoting complex subunit 3
MAMAKQQQGDEEGALNSLENAKGMDPHNAQAHYHKANVYASMRKYEYALKELKELASIAPRESAVYLLMGKVYKAMDQINNALQCFFLAMDLDPKNSPSIKAMIDKLHLSNDAADEEDQEIVV